MDRRVRELKRRWLETGDVNDHARYISYGLSCGDLDYDMVLLGAFMGHEACRIVAQEDVKPNGVVYKNRIIRNDEVTDWTWGILQWGKGYEKLIRVAVTKLEHTAVKVGWLPIDARKSHISMRVVVAYHIYYDDYVWKKAIREKIYPFALGDYQ